MHHEQLLALLAATDAVPPAAVRQASDAWSARRRPGEGLAEFLTRHEVLTPNAPDTLRWAGRGLVTLTDAGPLLRPDGLARLACCLPADHSTLPPSASSRSHTPRPAAWAETRRHDSAGSAARTVPAPRVHTSDGNPEIGTVLGKCLLTEMLGKGGAGVVYRALHQGLNIPVAVKVLHGVLLEKPEAYLRLKSEAQLLARLDHPNVVRVLDFEDDARYPFVVMECVEGMSLADLIRQSGGLSPARAVRVAARVADALAAAWKLGIVHRDVKPANILIAKDGTPKLADLGLAMIVSPGAAARDGAAGPNPEAVGTAAYMAPEQFMSADSVDFRADMYALGVTMYQAVAGQLPFQATSLPAMILKQIREQPVPPDQVAPGVPAGLSALILRLMAKDPAARFDSYESLLLAFRDVADAATRPAPAGVPRPSSGLSSVVGRFLRRPAS